MLVKNIILIHNKAYFNDLLTAFCINDNDQSRSKQSSFIGLMMSASLRIKANRCH